jgi:hypothetical protein
MSHWKIQVKCSCAGGSIGKIQVQVALEDPSAGSKSSFTLEGPLRSLAAGSAAYAGRSTGGREDDQQDGLVALSRTRATRTQANGLMRGRLSSRPS